MASKKQQAEEFKNQGNKEYSNKNYQKAIDLYTKAINLDSSNHVFFSNRSAAYVGNNQLDKALADGDMCIKLNRNWAKGYFRKGNALIEMHRFEEGVACFKEGLKYEPNNDELRKKLEEAEALLKKNKPRTNPDGTPLTAAQNAKEDGNEFFKASNYEKAIECYSRALSLAKENEQELKVAIYNNRANCWYQLYNHLEVVKDCTACLVISPNNLKALIRRGLAYEALEQMTKALADFRAILAIDPSITIANQAAHRISSAINKLQNQKKN